LERPIRIYVETSVISAYHFAPKSMMSATRLFFEKAAEEGYELYTSEVTIAELEKAREEVKEKSLDIIRRFGLKVAPRTIEARELAEEYVNRGMIPGKYRMDAEHIAIASVLGYDVLVSWNLAHIVKLKTKRMVQIINREKGYKVPVIIRPDEV